MNLYMMPNILCRHCILKDSLGILEAETCKASF